jgi:hypothetical protein
VRGSDLWKRRAERGLTSLIVITPFGVWPSRFGHIARTGLHTLIGKFKDIIFEVGFTIEGRDESELPEVMLGVCQFNKLDVNQAKDVVD